MGHEVDDLIWHSSGNRPHPQPYSCHVSGSHLLGAETQMLFLLRSVASS